MSILSMAMIRTTLIKVIRKGGTAKDNCLWCKTQHNTSYHTTSQHNKTPAHQYMKGVKRSKMAEDDGN
jgi:hypothetical protein